MTENKRETRELDLPKVVRSIAPIQACDDYGTHEVEGASIGRVSRAYYPRAEEQQYVLVSWPQGVDGFTCGDSGFARGVKLDFRDSPGCGSGSSSSRGTRNEVRWAKAP